MLRELAPTAFAVWNTSHIAASADANSTGKPEKSAAKVEAREAVDELDLSTIATRLSPIFAGANSPVTLAALRFVLSQPNHITAELVSNHWKSKSMDAIFSEFDLLNRNGTEPIPVLLLEAVRLALKGVDLAREVSGVLGRAVGIDDILSYEKFSKEEQDRLSDAEGDVDVRIAGLISEHAKSIDFKISALESRIAKAKAESAQAKAESEGYRSLLGILNRLGLQNSTGKESK